MIDFEYVSDWSHLEKHDPPKLTNVEGDKYWYSYDHKGYHREVGPAVIECQDGYQAWYRNGVPYRENELPTTMTKDGTWEFMNEGSVFHRLYYPALRINDDRFFWFTNGINITERVENWARDLNIDLFNLTDDDKLLYLMRFGVI